MQIGMPVTLDFIEEQDAPTIPGIANAGSNVDQHIACAVVAGLVVARPIIELQQDLLITVATRQRKPLPSGQSLILSPGRKTLAHLQLGERHRILGGVEAI